MALRNALDEYVVTKGKLPDRLSELSELLDNGDEDTILGIEWDYFPKAKGNSYIAISPPDSKGVKIGITGHFDIKWIYPDQRRKNRERG